MEHEQARQAAERYPGTCQEATDARHRWTTEDMRPGWRMCVLCHRTESAGTPGDGPLAKLLELGEYPSHRVEETVANARKAWCWWYIGGSGDADQAAYEMCHQHVPKLFAIVDDLLGERSGTGWGPGPQADDETIEDQDQAEDVRNVDRATRTAVLEYLGDDVIGAVYRTAGSEGVEGLVNDTLDTLGFVQHRTSVSFARLVEEACMQLRQVADALGIRSDLMVSSRGPVSDDTRRDVGPIVVCSRCHHSTGVLTDLDDEAWHEAIHGWYLEPHGRLCPQCDEEVGL